MADEISTLLDSYHSTTLWEMANEAGLEVTDRRNKRLNKAQVMAKMRAEFFSRERVLASLGRLDERERAVLDRLLLHGGTCPTASLRRELLRARLVTAREEDKAHSRYSPDVLYAGGYAGDPYRERSTEFVDVVARLTFRGLVFSADTSLTSGNVPYKLRFHPGRTLFVPEAVRRYLPEPEPLPIEVPDWQPEQVQPGDAALLLRDLLAELMADPQLGGSLARSSSPEVALLKKDRDIPLIAGLVARGLFPAVSGVEPEAADGSVLIGDDGIIRPVHAVPGLHLQGRLARVAEEGDDGTWRLTAASVRRAGGSKNKVLHLLEELGRLARGSLPARLVELIKAWGGYYGSAVAGTLTLIEFRDQEALDELRAHPELQELLTPFPAGSRALAVVPADRLAEVQEILNRLGVPIREGLARCRR